MANWADVQIVRRGDLSAVVAVTTSRPDGQPGCYYTVHRVTDGSVVRWGHSDGWDPPTGAGSALSAMKNGKASARRYLKAVEEGREQE